jgi:hypothetical protein
VSRQGRRFARADARRRGDLRRARLLHASFKFGSLAVLQSKVPPWYPARDFRLWRGAVERVWPPAPYDRDRNKATVERTRRRNWDKTRTFLGQKPGGPHVPCHAAPRNLNRLVFAFFCGRIGSNLRFAENQNYTVSTPFLHRFSGSKNMNSRILNQLQLSPLHGGAIRRSSHSRRSSLDCRAHSAL